MKKSDNKVEKLLLEADIAHYKFKAALGVWHDEDEVKEQRRRLWKLSILKRKEDDTFLRGLGLIHISKLKIIKK